MICRTGGNGHKGQRWILRTGGYHACAVGYQHIWTMVKLVPFVLHGSFWIIAHSATSHFMDIQSRSLVTIFRIDFFTATLFQHF